MQTVEVKKDELIAKLKENRDAHREIFLKAQEGYRNKMIEEFDRRLKDAREGRAIDRVFRMPEPQDFTKSFDTALAMLEMEVNDTVELTESDFKRYVQNEWEWNQQFIGSTQAYVAQ